MTNRAVDRLWPYQSSQKVKMNFWVINVYTGETIYSDSAITTGGSLSMGYERYGAAAISQQKASDIAVHNAFVLSTIDLIENLSSRQEEFLEDLEDSEE